MFVCHCGEDGKDDGRRPAENTVSSRGSVYLLEPQLLSFPRCVFKFFTTVRVDCRGGWMAFCYHSTSVSTADPQLTRCRSSSWVSSGGFCENEFDMKAGSRRRRVSPVHQTVAANRQLKVLIKTPLFRFRNEVRSGSSYLHEPVLTVIIDFSRMLLSQPGPVTLRPLAAGPSLASAVCG